MLFSWKTMGLRWLTCRQWWLCLPPSWETCFDSNGHWRPSALGVSLMNACLTLAGTSLTIFFFRRRIRGLVGVRCPRPPSTGASIILTPDHICEQIGRPCFPRQNSNITRMSLGLFITARQKSQGGILSSFFFSGKYLSQSFIFDRL